MPPFTIDPAELWAAIVRMANENDHSWRFTKKGDKRPRQDVEASMAGRRKAAQARRATASGETPATGTAREYLRPAPSRNRKSFTG